MIVCRLIRMVVCKKPILMIIYKRPAHLDDHSQKAGPSGCSFAKGRPIRMVICKKPIWMIICKRPVHLDDHLQNSNNNGGVDRGFGHQGDRGTRAQG